ncbi:GNAT family N-acetyltransferase [Rubrobacter tropicus]|uniref:GNAT family N-acetyltransferase n=1 Tax=Rubrobacter tropicus TaxID=2653851 RepID=A0A6G8QFF6_9ACTN|nr:GNAT family N-acetyltransferase [Rubrobacter tropicus]
MTYEAFDAGPHLSGVTGICRSLGWDNFRYDPDLTRRSLTAPGVTAVVAVARDAAEVVGFAQVFGDGVFQAHLGLLAVDEKWRRRGIGRGLVREAFARTGAERMDLIASDESLGFYRSLRHREQAGFRVYAGREEES